MAIGALVKKFREKHNLTVDEAVALSGVCRRTWQEVEYHDKNDLTVKTILKFARLFKIKPETFFKELLKGFPPESPARH